MRRFIREFAKAHDRRFRGITPEAMQLLVNAPWPGNVRELRNLIESMVVLAPGREIRAADIPAESSRGRARLLPVRLGAGAGQRRRRGQELEFILRSLVDLRLQVEELRRRLDERPQRVQVIDLGDHARWHDCRRPEVDTTASQRCLSQRDDHGGREKAAIEAALREYRGNRRRAAEVLGIGERTLYRKIKAYHLE